MSGFVGVHIGAGFHSEKHEAEYKSLCLKACQKGVDLLRSEASSIEAATVVMTVLENSELTNAGIGSNLTWDGSVECDASIMDGTSLQHGCVGSVSGVMNPIRVARSLCDAQAVPLSMGRVPPCLMVGSGARKWAEDNGIETVRPDEMITRKALKNFNSLKKLAVAGDSPGVREALDTVGVVVMNDEGRVASACSSGGILLKQPGRVGQASVYGCGCWAESQVAVAVSGCGEDLIKTFLAKEAATSLHSSACPTISLNNVVRSRFLESPFLPETSRRLCGLIGLVGGDSKEFIWAHTTHSFGVGYMATSQRKPKAILSRMPTSGEEGKSIVIQSVTW